VLGSLFVRRLVVSLADVDAKCFNLSSALQYGLEKRTFLEDAAMFIIEKLGGDAESSRTYLIMNCDELEPKRTRQVERHVAPGWLDDGMTTFALRVFDSRRNKLGIIRVSRHLTITYGLAHELITDLNNLIYEKILYATWPTGSDEIFSLLGALSEYVLPTEVSLYTHRVAQRFCSVRCSGGRVVCRRSTFTVRHCQLAPFCDNLFGPMRTVFGVCSGRRGRLGGYRSHQFKTKLTRYQRSHVAHYTDSRFKRV